MFNIGEMIMYNSYEFLYLNPREKQIEIIENSVKEFLRPQIREAYNYIVGVGKDSFIKKNEDAENLVKRIKELANHFALNQESKNIVSVQPESLITSNESIKKIFPIIKELRKELFSKEEPLFPDDHFKAIEWLKNKAKEEALPFNQNIVRNQKKIYEIEKLLEDKLQKLSKLTRRYYSLNIEEDRFLPIPLIVKGKFKGTLDYLIIWPQTPLARLEIETKCLAEDTNFNQVSLIMFILSGNRPIPLKYNFISEIKFGRFGIKKRVNIRIHRPLNKGELKEIHYKIKKAFGRKGKQFINEKHVELYYLIEKHGGAPETKKTEFWKKILKEWNRAHSELKDKYKDPNCTRIAYSRAKRYIQEQITADNFK